MKRLFVLMAFALVPVAAQALEGCKQKVPIESQQQICWIWNWTNNHRTQFNCAYPPSFNPVTESPMSAVVPAEDGEVCQAVMSSYYPASFMNSSHSASFTAWWNDRLGAPPGTGANGPAACYYTTMEGQSFCTPGHWDQTVTYESGVTYTFRHWTASLSGAGCQQSIYVYGTDGE